MPVAQYPGACIAAAAHLQRKSHSVDPWWKIQPARMLAAHELLTSCGFSISSRIGDLFHGAWT